ncbi:MAG: dihydroorotate dehydrogenase electron transfer subunit [Bacteroidaceae bacterium]|nr:dihydroorotate dehydrogenase electron transfer subunit [Bacteroidaceae bacterium]
MKKYILDLTVRENTSPHEKYALLKLTADQPLPEMLPGQFAEILIQGAQNTFLRRPISINYVDYKLNEVWFLVAKVGEGTRTLARVQVGDNVNVVLPLGHGFTLPEKPCNVLLVGGGVGTAPLLYFGQCLHDKGIQPTFLLGARSAHDLLQLDRFERLGKVCTTTEDGSHGEKGFVTQHSILKQFRFDQISACGPKPMMVSVARYAKAEQIYCEVSLENKMACGVGACLCCVEDTQQGHKCVCTEGPVFNINDLKWQI